MASDRAHDFPVAADEWAGEQTTETQADKLVGANEAARFLGIHRSTLHQAVKNGVITPDLVTQGGHFRFSRATLDTFAVRIAREPVTTLSELLPELTTTLGAPDGRRALCLKAYERISHALPDLTVFAVLGLKLHARSLLDLEVVASVGFPDWYLPELTANVERKDYEVKSVLRTLRPRYFDDTATAPDLRRPTRLLAHRGALHALAILPLTQDGEARGVLAVGSLHARKFRTPDIAFLQNTADELAIALACHDYMDSARAQILTSGALMREALRLRADSCAPEQPARRIASLVELLREATGADAVSLTAPGVDLASREETRALMRRVSRRESTAITRWGAPGVETTAIAALAPLNTRTNLVVVAEWTSEIIRQQEFEALLYVFAAACAIALGLDGSARRTVKTFRASGPRTARAAPVATIR
jgi:excisionase family DNA binding protein